MGITERKEKEKKEMRAAILDAAMRLFLDEGVEKVTMRRIANAIEYSPATIYLHFKDKNEILFALYTEGFERFYSKQLTINTIDNPWERLKEHARMYMSFALENREYYDLMFIMRAPMTRLKTDKEWGIGMRSYDYLKQNIKDCMEAGYIHRLDPDVAAFAIWSFTHGMASLIIRQRCEMIPESRLSVAVNAAIDFMTSGIMVPDSR